MISKAIRQTKDAVSWSNEGLWRIRLADVNPLKATALRWLRIIILSAREFSKDNCSLRASALTFYSVLSIVPLAAMAFGVAKGFGVDQMLENLIRDRLPGQEEAVALILDFSQNQLVQTRGGVVAGAGIMVLFWTVLRVLSNIERSFNEIWGIRKERSLARKFGDYLAFVVISPVILIAASSLTVFIIGMVEDLSPDAGILGAMSAPVLWATRLLPGMLIWGLFTFMYLFMPNARVAFSSALLGGVVAGSAYQITQAIYVNFQIGVAQYGAIYGSFAALPLFLIWLQLSWVIVLFGAELAYAHQNVDQYEFRPDSEAMSPAFRQLLALAIVQHCSRAFEASTAPPTAEAVAKSLGAPSNAVNGLLKELVDTSLLAEVATGEERAPGYLPATPPDNLLIGEVIQRLENLGGPDIPLATSPELLQLREALHAYWQHAIDSPANRPLNTL